MAAEIHHQAYQHHETTHHQHQEHVQHVRLRLQGQVLTRIIQDVQVNVAVVIRLRLHAQGRIRHTELLTETGNPFGHRHDALGIDPFQLNGFRLLGNIRPQPVQRIVAMIEFLVMKIHVRKRLGEMLQRLIVTAQLVVARSQRAVGTRYLIPVIVLLEQLQGTLGEGNDQLLPRQVPPVDHTHHPRPALHQQVEVLPVLQQLRHGLRSVRLEVHIPLLMAQHQAIHQVVELTHHHLFGSGRLIHAARTFHIIIVEKLRRIALQFLGHIHPVDGFQGLRFLLQIIIVDGRGDGELRAGIPEPTQDTFILHRLLILADALHAAQGTVAIIIEFLVLSRALANLHHAHIGHQTLQLVGRLAIDLLQQAVRPFEVHPDEGTEGQVVQSLRLDGRIILAQLHRPACQLLRLMPVLVAHLIRPVVERIGLTGSVSEPSFPTAEEG